MIQSMTLLGYRPFIDPLVLHDVWWLLIIPLSLGISIAYKAVRVGSLRRYPVEVLKMTVQIILAMIALAIASYLFVEVFVRILASQP